MRTEIKELHQRLKTTTVYVTHDQVEAMTMADRIVVLQDGNVEQIGAPLDLYDKPANLFVATFIGSPSMNLIKGKARIENGEVFVEAGNIRLPAGAAHTVADGQDVTYGIRPEHLELADDGFEGRVGVIEPTGSETMVFVHAGGNDLLALFRERHLFQPGQSIRLKPRKDAAHIFDTATGKRI
jgi:multiple sugar transport system ATP-binding protein